MKDLQNYLKDWGVTFSKCRKAELVKLCTCAAEVNIEVDPDGLVEDSESESVFRAKLSANGHNLTNPKLLVATADMSRIPTLSIFDLYNFLVGHGAFTHESLREYHKLEGYTMFKDGYVSDLKSAT